VALVSCPSCGRKLKVPDSAVGKRGRCPACASVFPMVSSEPASPEPQRNVETDFSDVRSEMQACESILASGAGTSDFFAARGPERAPRWSEAAAAGSADARYLVGRCHEIGAGVTRDESLAADSYRKAAEQGHVLAMHNLGTMFLSGRGIAPSDLEAVAWFRKAGDAGYAPSQYNLGFLYANGRGVPCDFAMAEGCYLSAARQGHAGAQKALDWLSRNEPTDASKVPTAIAPRNGDRPPPLPRNSVPPPPLPQKYAPPTPLPPQYAPPPLVQQQVVSAPHSIGATENSNGMAKFVGIVVVVLIGGYCLRECDARRVKTEKMNAIMQSWGGHDADELLAQWGNPTTAYSDNNGGYYFVYQGTRTDTRLVPQPGFTRVNNRWRGAIVYRPQQVTYQTHRTFHVNAYGIIDNWSWAGH